MKYIFLLFSFVGFLLAQSSFLMPDEAFKPDAHIENNKLIVNIKLAKSIYLYKKKLNVYLKTDNNLITKITYPKAIKHDGDDIYKNSVKIVADLKENNLKNIIAVVEYQGCSEDGLCYAPYTKEFNLEITKKAFSLLKPINVVKKNENISEKKVELSQSELIAQKLQSGNILLILVTFFGFGLLLSLTPCIFPIIPILSSIIVSQHGKMNAKRGFILSLVYVLSMSVAYTIAGVIAGLFGSNIQAYMQNPYILTAFSAIFVVLAISMFGFFEISLPASIQSRLTNHSDRASAKGGLIGVAIMGFLSALIVGPCVAPPLAGALIYIGQSADALLGGLALFTMSFGMGVPLLIIGTSAGKFMPKPGVWMNNISKIFGVVMLAIAIYMLNSVINAQLYMFLWALLFIISSVYLNTFESVKTNWQMFIKGFGITIFLIGFFLLVGVLSGATNPFLPLEKFTQLNNISNSIKNNFYKVTSIDELNEVLSKHRGKKVMLDFYATWCTSCKELEHITFKDTKVQHYLKDYILIQADITKNSVQQRELSKKYGVFGPPVIIFFDKNHNIVRKIVGYKKPSEFLQYLQ